MSLNERQVYEQNPLIQYLNFRQPNVFRLVWNAYLHYKKLQLREGAQGLPPNPITPILQARNLGTPPSSNTSETNLSVLIVTFTGWSFHTVMDAVIGRALAFRGANVQYLTCGGVLPICFIHNVTTSAGLNNMPCGRCRSYVETCLDAFGFPVDMLQDWVTKEEQTTIKQEIDKLSLDELIPYEYDGLKMGEAAYVTTCWYLVRVSEVDQEMEPYMRGYLYLARMVHAAMNKMLTQKKFDRIVIFNGLQVVDSIIRKMAERAGIDYITTERGVIPETFYLAYNDIAALVATDLIWEMYKDHPLLPFQYQQVENTLNKRRYGFQQVDNVWPQIEESEQRLREELKLDPLLPIIAVFPSVPGDTTTINQDLEFDDMFDWVKTILQITKEYPQLQFVIRIHPAETRIERLKPSRPIGDFIKENYPVLPSNVRVIPSQSILSSYTLVGMSNLVLVYISTLGLESAALGMPVAVSAKTHYHQRGFTYNAASPALLKRFITQWLENPTIHDDPQRAELARRYIHLMMYRYTIPLTEVLNEQGFGQLQLMFNDWNAIKYGQSPIIDAITDGILYGKPFLNPYADDETSSWAIASLK